ncbi:cysteine hydrolase family protein [Polymorphobacter sp.]|uniref:cysteine hydrolase family protein n=1 Tax=Polymorphobacter sp. TaxID=1909290 RepID=UPI003F722842
MTDLPVTPTLDSRTALIIVDMQQGFLQDESAMGRMGFDLSLLREALDPCVRLVDTARQTEALIVFTRYVYQPDYSDGGIMVELLPALKTEGALKAGDWEVELAEVFGQRDGEVVVDKSKPSAFHGTTMDAVLAARGIERVIVCGITTNCCVESTVRDASHRDLQTWVVTDAVAESARDRHDYAIQCMTMLFARGTTVAEVQAASAVHA